jgi:alkylation response protein AidB-like acyl-CoA dehydrogenase
LLLLLNSFDALFRLLKKECVHKCTHSNWRAELTRAKTLSSPRLYEEVATVNFAFTEEQEELRSFIRSFMEDKSSEATVRELMDTDKGYDSAVWSQMAEQLGLQSMIIPEEYGGQGFGYVELGIALEEMGRCLLCAPFFSTVVLAGNAIIHSGNEDAKTALLPGIADGSTIATLALAEANGRWDAEGITVEATGTGDGTTITGEKMFVTDGGTANLFVVAARAENGIHLYTVDGDAAGLSRENLSTMDQTRKQARITFEGTPASHLCDTNDFAYISKILDLAVVALANEQVGGAQFVMDMAVQYAKDRVQFGRPIGSFQAIKHKCADMLLEVESAKSAAYYAAWCASEMNEELPSVASLAKAYCSEAYFHCAAENIQIHGGIGFTWEHPAHLYFKRAKSSELIFGDPAYHRELLAQRIGL